MLKYVWDPRKQITRITLAYWYECMNHEFKYEYACMYEHNIKRVSSMWISISIKRMKNEYKCEYNRSISVITRRMSINTSISVNIRCMSIDMNMNIGVKHEG